MGLLALEGAACAKTVKTLYVWKPLPFSLCVEPTPRAIVARLWRVIVALAVAAGVKAFAFGQWPLFGSEGRCFGRRLQ